MMVTPIMWCAGRAVVIPSERTCRSGQLTGPSPTLGSKPSRVESVRIGTTIPPGKNFAEERFIRNISGKDRFDGGSTQPKEMLQ